MKSKKSSSMKKSSKSEKGKIPDFCGLKSDKSQEEMVSKLIEESPRVVEHSSTKTKVEFPDLDFCGLKSREGKLKMRSKYNIKKQAIMHSLTLKQEKKKKRLLKERKMLKIEKNAARDVKVFLFVCYFLHLI